MFAGAAAENFKVASSSQYLNAKRRGTAFTTKKNKKGRMVCFGKWSVVMQSIFAVL